MRLKSNNFNSVNSDLLIELCNKVFDRLKACEVTLPEHEIIKYVDADEEF